MYKYTNIQIAHTQNVKMVLRLFYFSREPCPIAIYFRKLFKTRDQMKFIGKKVWENSRLFVWFWDLVSNLNNSFPILWHIWGRYNPRFVGLISLQRSTYSRICRRVNESVPLYPLASKFGDPNRQRVVNFCFSARSSLRPQAVSLHAFGTQLARRCMAWTCSFGHKFSF